MNIYVHIYTFVYTFTNLITHRLRWLHNSPHTFANSFATIMTPYKCLLPSLRSVKWHHSDLSKQEVLCSHRKRTKDQRQCCRLAQPDDEVGKTQRGRIHVGGKHRGHETDAVSSGSVWPTPKASCMMSRMMVRLMTGSCLWFHSEHICLCSCDPFHMINSRRMSFLSRSLSVGDHEGPTDPELNLMLPDHFTWSVASLPVWGSLCDLTSCLRMWFQPFSPLVLRAISCCCWMSLHHLLRLRRPRQVAPQSCRRNAANCRTSSTKWWLTEVWFISSGEIFVIRFTENIL